MTRADRALLLGSLYLAQGLPYGFYTQALPLLLREQGVRVAYITAITAGLALPWAFKFLWAPWLDRSPWTRFGRRRTWILAMQAVSALLLVGLAAVDLAQAPTLVMLGILAVNLAAATQDIATDGLAVTLVPPAERGLMNGLQVAGYRVGMVLAGGALLMVYGTLGWTGSLLALAGLTVLASLPILRATEPPSPPPAATRSPLQALGAYVQQPGALAWLGLLAVFKFGEAFGVSVLRLVLQEGGRSIEEIGWLLGTGGFSAGLVGALLGGALVNPLGRHRAVLVTGGLQALAVAAYAMVPYLSDNGVLALILTEHLASGMASAALFTRMMDACRPGEEGSDYTLQASVVVMATGSAAAISGLGLEGLGPSPHFLLAGALSALALLPALRARPPGG
jgi:predicted MFS family arabinose efflux permease